MFSGPLLARKKCYKCTVYNFIKLFKFNKGLLKKGPYLLIDEQGTNT